MNAWQILISNSSLAIGNAWEHLNNQIAGVGNTINVILGGTVKASVTQDASAEITRELRAAVSSDATTATASNSPRVIR